MATSATAAPPLTLDDVRDPQRLFYYLRLLANRLVAAESTTATTSSAARSKLTSQDVDQLAATMQRELSSIGRHPLPVEGLQGRTSQAQRAAIVIFTTDPTTTVDANLYDVGTIGTFGSNLYYVASGNPHTWATMTLTVAPHNVLSATHGDTLAAGVARGAMIVGNSTPKWASVALGAANTVWRVNGAGTDPGWGAVADAALSANVALLNVANAWSAAQTFNSTATFNAAVRFAVFAFAGGTQTLSSERFISIDVSGSAATAKFPAAPTTGDWYYITDTNLNCAANNITLDGNGKNLNGSATRTMNVNGAKALYFYQGSQWTGGIW